MNICHLTHTDVLKDSRVLKQLVSLSDGLQNLNVYAIGVKSPTGPENLLVSDKIKVISITPVPRWLRPKLFRHMLVFLKLCIYMLVYLVKVKPRIIHCHDTLVLPIGLIYKQLSNCKLIYDAHELETQKNGQTWFLSIITYIFEKFAWSSVDLFITVSSSINKFYQDKFGLKRSILVLNSPAVELSKKMDSDLNVRFEFKFKPEEKVYVYLGILGKGRGIELALEAFESVSPRNKIVFIGWGDLEHRIKASERFGLNVFVRSAVAHSAVPQYVSTANFGLCLLEPISLSDYFALPNKLFEYAFAGIPILASDFPDIRAIVQQHKLGMCFEPKLKGLIDVIEREENSEYVLTQSNLFDLSWQKQEEKLLSEYRELVVGN